MNLATLTEALNWLADHGYDGNGTHVTVEPVTESSEHPGGYVLTAHRDGERRVLAYTGKYFGKNVLARFPRLHSRE